ncbi:MAG: acyltransferase family protein [Deltaproteobacteria bacterium]|nr:acyltransferase family protein [Deltaproteobacteria bacterium]
MASAAQPAPAGARLSWLDGMKGISILWIAFFHFFNTYANNRYPSPLGPDYCSSFVARPELVDYRFVLSLLGDRVYPVESIFYYFNPALWYFGLLAQLYLVFPVLFRLLQKLGSAWFLILCGLVTLVSRYLLLNVLSAHGYYVQGAFFGSRLWEFAAGMALGLCYRRH